MAAGPFTAGFGFKTGSDRFYHSRLLEPTQKASFIVGSIIANAKKIGPPGIRTRVSGAKLRGLNH